MVSVQFRSPQQPSTISIVVRRHCLWALLLACCAPLVLSASSSASPSLSSAVAVQPDCLTARASACGDPHFKGFDGRPFDFQGHAGGSYNLISEQEHQLNAKFVSDSDTSGTWLDELVLKCKDDVVHMRTMESGRLSGELHSSQARALSYQHAEGRFEQSMLSN
jgi:hypothetical protein